MIRKECGCGFDSDLLTIPMNTQRRRELIEKIKGQNLSDQDFSLPIVSLEDFFIGNDDYGSIGCNLLHHPGPQAFFETLKFVRDKPEVQDVLVEIYELQEENEDVWPFSERIYIVSNTTGEQISDWVSLLEPDEILESFAYPISQVTQKLEPGMRIFAVWWD